MPLESPSIVTCNDTEREHYMQQLTGEMCYPSSVSYRTGISVRLPPAVGRIRSGTGVSTCGFRGALGLIPMGAGFSAPADAAEHGYWVGGAHLPFPGMGHLRSAGSGYLYVPANYGTVH
jgi:hypothetical protein